MRSEHHCTRCCCLPAAIAYITQLITLLLLLLMLLELETKAIRRFAKVSTVSYSRPSLMIIASASQFHRTSTLGGPTRAFSWLKAAIYYCFHI